MSAEQPLNIAIFASGSGSNAQQIMQHFGDSKTAQVSLILSNNANAFVLQRAETFGVPSVIVDKKTRLDGEALNGLLYDFNIDLVVLAGYMKLIPEETVDHFRGRILNIHPALLPSYGGEGMYGDHVHSAVLENGEEFSGITIHLVDEVYDQGDILFQEKIKVHPQWDLSKLREEIHKLEHQLYPTVIENVCRDILDSRNKS